MAPKKPEKDDGVTDEDRKKAAHLLLQDRVDDIARHADEKERKKNE